MGKDAAKRHQGPPPGPPLPWAGYFVRSSRLRGKTALVFGPSIHGTQPASLPTIQTRTLRGGTVARIANCLYNDAQGPKQLDAGHHIHANGIEYEQAPTL
jgi:hypothetical protein